MENLFEQKSHDKASDSPNCLDLLSGGRSGFTENLKVLRELAPQSTAHSLPNLSIDLGGKSGQQVDDSSKGQKPSESTVSNKAAAAIADAANQETRKDPHGPADHITPFLPPYEPRKSDVPSADVPKMGKPPVDIAPYTFGPYSPNS